MESIKKLKQVLTDMTEAHQQLLNLAQQKRTILVEGKVAELQTIISKESKWTEQIRQLEELREQVLKESLSDMGIVSNSLTMVHFIQNVNEPEDKQFLTKITAKLRGVVTELSQLNRNNQELIQMALSYIQYSINIIMPKEPSIGYGMKQTARSARLFDAKF